MLSNKAGAEGDSFMHFPLFTDMESSFKGKNGESFDDTSHPKLASATLVQPNTWVMGRATTTFNPTKQIVEKSPGSNTHSNRIKRLEKDTHQKISGLESFREP